MASTWLLTINEVGRPAFPAPVLQGQKGAQAPSSQLPDPDSNSEGAAEVTLGSGRPSICRASSMQPSKCLVPMSEQSPPVGWGSGGRGTGLGTQGVSHWCPSRRLRTEGARCKVLWCHPICPFCRWGKCPRREKGTCSNLHSKTGVAGSFRHVVSQGGRGVMETEARQRDVRQPSSQGRPPPHPDASRGQELRPGWASGSGFICL